MATNDLLLHVAESAMAHLEFSTSGYIERNQLWRLGVPKARKPRSNFLDNVSFSTGCRYITTSCLASAILNFWLSVILTISAMAPLSSWASKTWVEPLRSRFYLIWKPRYKYFRFTGRHLEFPTSGYIEYHPWYHYFVPEPRKHSGSRCNFVYICLRSLENILVLCLWMYNHFRLDGRHLVFMPQLYIAQHRQMWSRSSLISKIWVYPMKFRCYVALNMR